MGTLTSSINYKENINPYTNANIVDNLNVVTFNYKQEYDQEKSYQIGLIAEDVEKLDTNLIVYDNNNNINTVKYHFLIPILIKKCQELQTQLNTQNQLINDLTNRITILENK
jgi:hypothetical protein